MVSEVPLLTNLWSLCRELSSFFMNQLVVSVSSSSPFPLQMWRLLFLPPPIGQVRSSHASSATPWIVGQIAESIKVLTTHVSAGCVNRPRNYKRPNNSFGSDGIVILFSSRACLEWMALTSSLDAVQANQLQSVRDIEGSREMTQLLLEPPTLVSLIPSLAFLYKVVISSTATPVICHTVS